MRYMRILAPTVAVLLLAGCAGNPEDNYLSDVRESAPVLKQIDDETLLNGGRSVCAQLKLEATRFQVVQMLTPGMSGVLSEPEVAALVNAAGDHLCPGEGK